MKELYLELIALLKAVPDIKWIDLDNGQLDRKDPALKYPCTLVKLISTNKDIDEVGSQNKDWSVQLRTAFDATGSRTAADTPQSALNRSLDYTRVADVIYDKFQATSPLGYQSLECTGEVQETRSDGLVVFKHNFKTAKMVFKE